MDEQLRFVARMLEGEKIAACAGNSIAPARRATSSSIVTRSGASRGSPTEVGVPIATGDIR